MHFLSSEVITLIIIKQNSYCVIILGRQGKNAFTHTGAPVVWDSWIYLTTHWKPPLLCWTQIVCPITTGQFNMWPKLSGSRSFWHSILIWSRLYPGQGQSSWQRTLWTNWNCVTQVQLSSPSVIIHQQQPYMVLSFLAGPFHMWAAEEVTLLAQ